MSDSWALCLLEINIQKEMFVENEKLERNRQTGIFFVTNIVLTENVM